MHRKHFIKISTLSLAGLLITDFTIAGGKKNPVIQMPDQVQILFDDTYLPMQSSDQQTWKYKEAIVELNKAGDRIEIYVQSPAMKLKEVKLLWKHATADTASILGDAYERTYGDISWQKISDNSKDSSAKKLPWYCAAHDDNNTLCL